MKIVIEIICDNAAFEDNDNELARILREFAYYYKDTPIKGVVPFSLKDINGNTVGTAKVIK